MYFAMTGSVLEESAALSSDTRKTASLRRLIEEALSRSLPALYLLSDLAGNTDRMSR
jgi:hypothetical protein